MFVSLCVCMFVFLCLCMCSLLYGDFSPTGLGPGPFSQTSAPVPEYGDFLGTHMDCGLCLERVEKACPIAGVYRPAQSCAWVCDMPTASAEDRCLQLSAETGHSGSNYHRPRLLEFLGVCFSSKIILSFSIKRKKKVKKKNLLGESVSHCY